jgi:hypothetical protein
VPPIDVVATAEAFGTTNNKSPVDTSPEAKVVSPNIVLWPVPETCKYPPLAVVVAAWKPMALLVEFGPLMVARVLAFCTKIIFVAPCVREIPVLRN